MVKQQQQQQQFLPYINDQQQRCWTNIVFSCQLK